MKTFLFIALLLIPFILPAQSKYPRISEGALWFNEMDRYMTNTDITLGPATGADGNYRFITVDDAPLPGSSKGSVVEVKKFRDVGEKKVPDWRLSVRGDNVPKAEIKVDSALACGEILSKRARVNPQGQVYFPNNGLAFDSLLYSIFPVRDGKIKYEAVISAPGVMKDEIYNRSRLWALGVLTSQKAALQIDDKQAGLIAYRINIPRMVTFRTQFGAVYDERRVWINVKIYIKDEKAKFVLDKVEVESHITTINSYTDDSKWNIEDLNDRYTKMKAGPRERALVQEYEWMAGVDSEMRATIAGFKGGISQKVNSEADF